MTSKWRDALISAAIVFPSTLVHLLSLANFPIFADEAIYIRWAQLIIDDWQQYLFFALNDGKSPLFIWLIAPFQFLVSDQLVAARVVSMIVGISQAIASRKVVQALGGGKPAQYMAMGLSVWLPFWFFAQHLALMDGLLTFFLTWTIFFTVQISQQKITQQLPIRNVVLLAISIGLGLWTKLPALLFLPGLLLFPWLKAQKWEVRRTQLIGIVAGIVGGLSIFACLRISPAFSQLFVRSQDFAATDFTLASAIPRWFHVLGLFIRTLYQYVTFPVLLLALAGLFYNQSRRKVAVLILTTLFFAGAFIVGGEVVHSRYFLPAILGITLAAALSFEVAYDHWIEGAKNLHRRTLAAIVLVSFLGLSLNSILAFAYTVGWAADSTPFLPEDKEEYLLEWSSGHGIRQVVELLATRNAAGKSTAVATEGRFGSLPDGILVFFHRRNVDHLYIEGIGQYPVKSIPAQFATRAKDFNQSLLVVNSHRMQLTLPENQKVAEYCRPFSAPCLQVWDITAQVKAVAATNSQTP